MTLIGRASVRTVLLTSLLLTCIVLVMLARAEDVATLEYEQPLPATNERPRLDKGHFYDSLCVHDVYSIAIKHPIIASGRFPMMFRNALRLLSGHVRHPPDHIN
ncbi:hypothetical protein DMN91_005873 [Ooceraea biroi]|uniref:Uncharacterized protein n=1 Tax=Ooceraea biroi TaxID=2015173 RepID=A0A3L8DM37_OOCBI|nr:hypothetical protein DMN91_005873 [Ooceraea biroi]